MPFPPTFLCLAKLPCYVVSTGIRFTTLPDATPPSFQVPSSPSSTSTPLSASASASTDAPASAGPSQARGPPSQPPTTITALFNPMLGHISGAYAARVSRDLSLASRFDFNVYSYESEWSIGAEWWQRRGLVRPVPPPSIAEDGQEVQSQPHTPSIAELADEVQGVVKAKVSTTTVRTFPIVRATLVSSAYATCCCRTSRCFGKVDYGISWSASASCRTSPAAQNRSSRSDLNFRTLVPDSRTCRAIGRDRITDTYNIIIIPIRERWSRPVRSSTSTSTETSERSSMARINTLSYTSKHSGDGPCRPHWPANVTGGYVCRTRWQGGTRRHRTGQG